MMQRLLTSNEPLYINHYNSIFEELWKNGVDAKQRIRDIEEGTDLAEIEVFQGASRAREVYLALVKEAKKEILLIFPTTNAFSRQYRIGAIELAEKAALGHNVHVRILMPVNKSSDGTIQNLYYPHKINVRFIEQMSETKATILIVDRKDSLVMELRDDSKLTFDEAIGLSTYSNSKAGVLSYVAIFENLWKQTELYEQVINTNEQLKMHDKAQKEFINIAAHELRNPIQPIVGLSDLLLHSKQNEKNEKKQREMMEIIVRNAKRLQRLTEDILDVTKIESNLLTLKKEFFNLNELLQNTAIDLKNQIIKEHKVNSVILQIINSKEDIFVEADKARINQVISNLLNNAIKFTNKGSINISAYKRQPYEVVVSIKDTGSGLDPEILPRLFSKFATTSDTGTGLGLFISRSIIEAHSGRIWAENNLDGKGATFAFSLPLIRSCSESLQLV